MVGNFTKYYFVPKSTMVACGAWYTFEADTIII